MTMKDEHMDLREPQWWLILIAAGSAFVGWRTKEAVGAAKRCQIEEEQKAIKARLSEIERQNSGQDAKLTIDADRMERIFAAIDRIDRKLEGKADK